MTWKSAYSARERRGVTVNDYLQSVSNPAVYAAGDAAASGPPLTPTAAHDGEVSGFIFPILYTLLSIKAHNLQPRWVWTLYYRRPILLIDFELIDLSINDM
jgi:hypothetical protein